MGVFAAVTEACAAESLVDSAAIFGESASADAEAASTASKAAFSIRVMNLMTFLAASS